MTVCSRKLVLRRSSHIGCCGLALLLKFVKHVGHHLAKRFVRLAFVSRGCHGFGGRFTFDEGNFQRGHADRNDSSRQTIHNRNESRRTRRTSSVANREHGKALERTKTAGIVTSNRDCVPGCTPGAPARCSVPRAAISFNRTHHDQISSSDRWVESWRKTLHSVGKRVWTLWLLVLGGDSLRHFKDRIPAPIATRFPTFDRKDDPMAL